MNEDLEGLSEETCKLFLWPEDLYIEAGDDSLDDLISYEDSHLRSFDEAFDAWLFSMTDL